ncbi:unnamed protein product [Penicillium roqueforti FM164]|uniref:Genomic scaffold, ProqFM164S01 n=1 Tax=Penicillium roqueforti (strain FM164) TaxID=1365484 RepID=W6PRL5_PENRF|nr:unnamed protein product [Penicillium roqueforti FM164]
MAPLGFSELWARCWNGAVSGLEGLFQCWVAARNRMGEMQREECDRAYAEYESQADTNVCIWHYDNGGSMIGSDYRSGTW